MHHPVCTVRRAFVAVRRYSSERVFAALAKQPNGMQMRSNSVQAAGIVCHINFPPLEDILAESASTKAFHPKRLDVLWMNGTCQNPLRRSFPSSCQSEIEKALHLYVLL